MQWGCKISEERAVIYHANVKDVIAHRTCAQRGIALASSDCNEGALVKISEASKSTCTQSNPSITDTLGPLKCVLI